MICQVYFTHKNEVLPGLWTTHFQRINLCERLVEWVDDGW